jgi:hypothetical protein
MSIRMSVRWAARVVAVWLLAGCSQEERAPALSEKAPFDVQQVMDRVRFSFRAEGEGWEGGHSTYSVRVEAGGFSFKPYHYPRNSPEAVEALRASPEQRAGQAESSTQKFVEGAPVRVGAARVTRAGLVMSSHLAKGRVKDSGGLTLFRGAVEEHFRNSKDGVEQSWSFEQKLEGTGDLEVRMPVERGNFLGETDQGLHFAAGATGLSVRYGHGTWVDAKGQRTAVPARYEAGAIVLRVPEQVVEASVYPALLDPVISPQIGMDDPVNGPADAGQYNPAVAHNGTNFLVVWEDSRSNNSDIYGARVSNAGAVLDTTGIRISAARSSQSTPKVAHNGTDFLVVWYDYRNGTSDIYGARVSNAGTVLDAGGIPISTASNYQGYPAVAYDGTNFLVVWEDYRSGINNDIYGARVSGTGTVLDVSGIPISMATNDQRLPSVAHNGANFLVVWQDLRSGTGHADIYGARVSGAGTVLNTSGILISNAVNAQELPAVAYNGVDFVVAWQDRRSGTSYDIYGARVSGTGVVRNPSGIPISTAVNDQRVPALAREGTNCLVVWQDYRSYDIYGARMTSTGTVLDTNGVLISTVSSNAYSPAVAHDGTNFLVVWQDHTHNNSPNIYGVQVSGGGTVLGTSDIAISRSANGQYIPAVAHDGMNFLVVWQDYRNGLSEIYGTRLDEMGTVLDTSGIAIATSGSSKHLPAVIYGGTNFLVVWLDYRSGGGDIYGARVSSDGSVLDAAGIPISTAVNFQSAPAVAFNGVDFLVVWEDYRSGTNHDIYGARVSNAGSVLDLNGIPISSADNSQSSPAVSQNGENFLVVWKDYRSGTNYDIYGARVTGAGAVIDSTGLPISTATNSQYDPVIAYNGVSCLVAWYDLRSGTSYDIYGARVDSTGAVLDPTGFAISAATANQFSPAVAYDGANFVVVWEDFRSGTGFTDIYGVRVGENGTVLDASGIPISTEPVSEVRPRITAMGGETSFVVYRSSDTSANTNSERVLGRLLQFP